MPTRMLVSPLTAAAENEQAHHRPAHDEDGRIDPGADEQREHGRGDDHADPTRQCPLGQANGAGEEEPHGDGSEAALYRVSPAPPFEPPPEPARAERDQARRPEEGDDDDESPHRPRNPLTDRRHHHHIGTGGDLAQAVEVNELSFGEPVIHVDGESLELRKRRQAAADGQEGQVGEDPDERRELAHRPGGTGASVRGLYHQMATPPTVTSTTRIGRWSRFTPMTASATKARSSI